MGCFYSRKAKEEDNVYDMTRIRNLPVIFVNGVPGAGNQTVAQTISSITGYTVIRPGDLVRGEAEKDTARGRLIADRLNAQDEVPEQLTVDLIKEEMLTQQEAKGFILVGFPKSPRMSSMFHRQVKWPEKIVALEVDDEVAATRLQNKLSELGRPESEINAARQIVKDAAHKVKNVHKRLGGHVVTLDSSSNPKALASTLKEILSDMLDQNQQEEARQPPGSDEEVEVSSVVPVEVEIPIDKPIMWILGGPGCGKGTQCDRIVAKYGYTHLSTGDLLREEVKSGSDRGKHAASFMERGELVPTEIVLNLLKRAIEANLATSKGFLIDGYPREKSQGKMFEQLIAPCTLIIYFEASPPTLLKRLMGRAVTSTRLDDNEETIKMRVNTFMENNDQVIPQYPEKLRRIDAERGVDEIFADVQVILDAFVKASTLDVHTH